MTELNLFHLQRQEIFSRYYLRISHESMKGIDTLNHDLIQRDCLIIFSFFRF